MTVKEVIEKLKEYDQDAEFQIRFETYATRSDLTFNFVEINKVPTVEIEVE